MDMISVNGKQFSILRLLGKGKGGYSYLVTDGHAQYVVKQIHHEPCVYYTFGNKLESELRDYRRLADVGLRLPELLEVDEQEERLLKQYIEGDTINDLVWQDGVKPEYFEQVRDMAQRLQAAGLNIDYFPTNFVVCGGLLYYIDYECNAYMDEWNFENWGVKYWYKSPEFLAHWAENK